MILRKMLDTLSRSSAHAVSTLDNRNSSAVKSYLYIETEIEQTFKEMLQNTTQPDQIIFLCGSSGDGKSEILARNHETFRDQLDFHFDATHSFHRDKDAIATLNDTFTQHKASNKPMVVGINTGMMFNYSDSGADEHQDIKETFRAYLGDKQSSPNANHTFLNFEDYPKYKLIRDQFLSPFIKDLLTRLTIADEKNPFFHVWMQEDSDPILHSNFRMLQQESVQDVIINTLLKLRLKNDVFLTARTILDFVHHILTGPNYLFDNLFASEKTDLFKALRQFDPCTVRSREIDLFLIQSSLTFDDPEFQAFQDSVAEWINPKDIAQKPGSWVRLFCLLQDIDISNNFHQRFKDNFRSELFEEYVRIWKLHTIYEGDSKERKELKNFYKKGLVSALLGFANRFAPSLSLKSQIFLNDYNGYQVSAKAEIRESLKQVQQSENRPARLGYFNACLKLGDEDLVPLPISVNFLDLIRKINRGYRPNRHDKNNIIILEEVIEDITSRIRNTDKLFIQKKDESWALINDVDEDEIRVER
ncbi:DNA phosphorothioation-dependent restriction protein DptF [Parendozoicomonas sp. Alg238-R29]|uniref:DNA phosphorothioation-dependent restriction protein DptF n=1 Tax=Parendozoicomonas sp. Alg238-R29 TaxID=2993446 RepID=UPI00248D7A45|nr:DNA phosphorothioation-dependent restriction protein DptF [Parendozoicomonas sp. Alg238-R29]